MCYSITLKHGFVLFLEIFGLCVLPAIPRVSSKIHTSSFQLSTYKSRHISVQAMTE